MLPFTGIFASDGSLLKELTLKDDEKITEMAAAHDNRVTSLQSKAPLPFPLRPLLCSAF
jgi:hypothetical protein